MDVNNRTSDNKTTTTTAAVRDCTVHFFLGPPGSGKSSQAQRIAQQLGLLHISSGDLLREHKASHTPLGRYMRENWNVRALSDIATELVMAAVTKGSHGGCVLDGTPRTQEEAIKLFSWLSRERIRVGAIFEFYVEDDTILMGRLLGRRMHSETGAIHHVTSLASGGADHDLDHQHEQRSSYIRREDDQDEAEIEKRMRSFKRFMPQIRQTLRQFSKGTGVPVHEIDASRNREEIYDELMLIISRERTQARRPLPSPLPLQPNRTAERAARAEVQPPTGFVKAGALDHCIVKQEIKESSRAQQIVSFPGTHPVTLARHHLPLIGAVSAVEAGAVPQTGRLEAEPIGRSQYVVTDKLDGERYFFYLDQKQCWLIDRRLNVFACPLSSPSEQGAWNEAYADTLLDGELFSLPASVADADSTGKRKRAETDKGIAARLHFVAFDAITIGGTNLASLPFRERMEEAQKRLGRLLGSTRGPLTLHIQRYVSLGELPALLAQKEEGGGEASAGLPLFPATLFPTDGLILQNAASPYRVGHSDDLLKWKDPYHNTIDFRLLSPLTADSGQEGWWQGCVVNKQGQDIPFDWIKVNLDEHLLEAPVSVMPGEPTKKARRGSTGKANEGEEECREDLAVIGEGAIVECWWDPTRQLDPWYYQHWYGADYEQKGYGQGGWRVHRVRTDKETPNVDWVAKKVWESINEAISLADIVAAI